MFKKLIFIGIFLFLLSFLGYNYIYQDPRNIAQEKAKFVLESEKIVETFIADQAMAEKKYLNKTLAIKGKIVELNADDLILDNKVFCMFTNPTEALVLYETITVKGRCIGFDTLLGQLKMDQCKVMEK